MNRSQDEVEKLIQQYKWLVRVVAKRCFPECSKDEDILQCGMIGLWEAAVEWNPIKSNFKTFATYCIRNNMKDYMRIEQKSTGKKLSELQHEDCNFEEDHIDLIARIESAWPANSRERYILIALSNGVSMLSVASALGIQLKTAQGLAEKAWNGIKKEDGD